MNVAMQAPRTPREAIAAAAADDVAAVARWLAAGRPSGPLDPFGLDLMHVAAQAGALRVVRTLADAECDLSPYYAWGMTPLHLAAREGHHRVVRWFAEQKECEIDACDHGGRTPIEYALDAGAYRSAMWLIACGAMLPPWQRLVEYRHRALAAGEDEAAELIGVAAALPDALVRRYAWVWLEERGESPYIECDVIPADERMHP